MATPLLPSASSDDAAVAAHPPWMLVAPYGKYDSDDRQYFTADPRTAASALTSNGCHVSVALRPAPPPALSRICIRFPRGVRSAYSTVIAAHGDSFLLSVVISYSMRCCMTDDYFLYSAGDHERARLPSLTLLPKPCWLQRSATGLLRRGEAELVVAQLRMPAEAATDGDVVPAPELILFRSGEWRVVRPRVINGNGWEGLLSQRWESTAVVPLGGGRLCWVDKWSSGLLVADVFEETRAHAPAREVSHEWPFLLELELAPLHRRRRRGEAGQDLRQRRLRPYMDAHVGRHGMDRYQGRKHRR
ncbi:unnamed protein product [Urochloa humidicola]